ncbi:glycoside hydrolase family 57 protein [Sulfurihydrogenibium azorense]|jgi:1,4-alpha-glucan branching enzyme|uniref:Glycoside hydrolase, family 57 n=1 Tax=Sulfurihydrogenibium azorense (strain DSM 15241 / OCM 825 / Az-Fu1) TaxID=204536 RepID=C1DXF1_SULAA|nr:1,4-alpha-glucan branching protein domain-containing protein [Sulfurihydrogenibium azorense]ACN98567.1 glycoside hydrolase, family 57 [Sulfurihydrogenibium azorense Az-Fu1]
MKGYWMLVLHSHLPFVKHPEYEYFLEEHWLFEAITETYIPLLMTFKQLKDENVDFRLTTSLTPPLLSMLTDKHLMSKYEKYLDKMILLTEKEINRTKASPTFNKLARFYNERFLKIKDFYYGFLGRNVLNGYRYFEESKNLEIITCNATHGFLPLLSPNITAIERQIDLAVKSHERFFGKKPKGIWLAECAYYDGLDKILSKYGIEYFFLDSHGVIFGKPFPRYGVFAPVYTPSKVAVFARDPESSKQVWSAKEGYPGDPNYRDFYRDIGFDLDFEYIKDFISPDGVRVYTGIKYYKITGDVDLSQKKPYDPDKAYEMTKVHAGHFHISREKQMEHLSKYMDRLPLVVSPYDAELFGHWWFEGPDFLYNVFKMIDTYKQFKPITPSEYLDLYPENQVVRPSPSSWGDKGYYEVWLNPENHWVYKYLHQMEEDLVKVKKVYESNDIIKQMERELLLAQSSDWTFLITTQTAKQYATNRLKEHIGNFYRLKEMLDTNIIDFGYLTKLKEKNSIFSDIL